MVDIAKGQEEQSKPIRLLNYGVLTSKIGKIIRHMYNDYYLVEVDGEELLVEDSPDRKEFEFVN